MDPMNADRFAEVMRIVEESRGLGSRVLANGTQIIGHVPHVAVEGYLHEIYPGLSDAEIETLETGTLRRPIPEVYKAFLKVTNGATFFVAELALDGARTDYSRTGDECRQPFDLEMPNLYGRPRDARNGEFFIGGYREDGSLLYLRDGRVFRCSRKSVNPLNEWSGFWEMLVGEVARIAKHFDSTGRRKVPKESLVPPAY